MRQSGYRTVFHIYLIFFLSFLGTLLSICCISVLLITTQDPEGKTVRSDWAKKFTMDISEYIIFVNGSPKVKQVGMELLQDYHVGLQILDTTGKVVYEYQKPDNAQNSYSITDLLQLSQKGHLDTENITSFVGIVTEGEKSHAYILHFPMNIQKVTMYLNGERFTGGKKIAFITIGILLTAVIFLGLTYGFLITKAIRKLVISIGEIASRSYLPVKVKGAFGDLYNSLNDLDSEIKASDKLQEETERLRREWISNITHDLKTPLSPIKGYAEIINDDTEKTASDYKRYAGIMLKNAIYMENLIDDLKLTWQLENGVLPINKKDQSIIRFLRELSIDILNRPEYESRTILFDYLDENAHYSFDEKLFTRAFQNLIINAFVHGNEDTVVTVQITSNKNSLNIIVADNGDGMSVEETERLFERYYRGANTESKTEGTGLGLAIAKSIIELHGGTISVTSTPGVGTSFLICFPCD